MEKALVSRENIEKVEWLVKIWLLKIFMHPNTFSCGESRPWLEDMTFPAPLVVVAFFVEVDETHYKGLML